MGSCIFSTNPGRSLRVDSPAILAFRVCSLRVALRSGNSPVAANPGLLPRASVASCVVVSTGGGSSVLGGVISAGGNPGLPLEEPNGPMTPPTHAPDAPDSANSGSRIISAKSQPSSLAYATPICSKIFCTASVVPSMTDVSIAPTKRLFHFPLILRLIQLPKACAFPLPAIYFVIGMVSKMAIGIPAARAGPRCGSPVSANAALYTSPAPRI